MRMWDQQLRVELQGRARRAPGGYVVRGSAEVAFQCQRRRHGADGIDSNDPETVKKTMKIAAGIYDGYG